MIHCTTYVKKLLWNILVHYYYIYIYIYIAIPVTKRGYNSFLNIIYIYIYNTRCIYQFQNIGPFFTCYF
uniref:Putative ovule protein n=1 Tax=Solanum chacoense TaxID=4108 RepID=A0A0V0GSB2_SOLCH